MGVLTLFIYLQVLHFLTTLLFLKLGMFEASWLVAVLIRWSPILGVALAKAGTITLALLAVRLHKDRLMHWVNTGYGGVIVWNLFCMIVAEIPQRIS